jgi:hypothetical protein
MKAFFEEAAMNLPTRSPAIHPIRKPRQTRRIAAAYIAYIAYLTSVCASMAAAAAVVTETAPLTLGGF